MSPCVSVIVPTYNRPELLRRALASITAQTFRDYQIVVVNDGGCPVLDVVAEFPQTIYLSHAKNWGLSAARNLGLKYAAGRYIAYLDDDDEFYPQHLELCVQKLREGLRFVYSDAYYVQPDGCRKLAMSNTFNRFTLKWMNLFPVCCAVHDRFLVDEAGHFDETLTSHEDWDLWIRMASVTRFEHIPVITCGVYVGGETMSADRERMIETYKQVRARYA